MKILIAVLCLSVVSPAFSADMSDASYFVEIDGVPACQTLEETVRVYQATREGGEYWGGKLFLPWVAMKICFFYRGPVPRSAYEKCVAGWFDECATIPLRGSEQPAYGIITPQP